MPADSPAPTSPSEAYAIAMGQLRLAKWILSRPDLYGPNDNSKILSEALLSSQERAAEAQARVADLELLLRCAIGHGEQPGPLWIPEGLENGFQIDHPTCSEEDLFIPRGPDGLPALNDATRAAARAALRESRP